MKAEENEILAITIAFPCVGEDQERFATFDVREDPRFTIKYDPQGPGWFILFGIDESDSSTNEMFNSRYVLSVVLKEVR